MIFSLSSVSLANGNTYHLLQPGNSQFAQTKHELAKVKTQTKHKPALCIRQKLQEKPGENITKAKSEHSKFTQYQTTNCKKPRQKRRENNQ